MRSLLARLALVGLVGIALVGCGTSNGTTLLSGSVPNNSGGGTVNSTNGVGAPPAGLIASFMIDNGNAAAASSYVGFNAVVADVQSAVQAWTDPAPAPPSPSGPTPSQATDPGSHSVTGAGNNTTQVIMRYSGVVPNLTYAFGAPGNAGTFDMGSIVSHFWFGTKATGSVTIASATSGDTVTICLNGPTGCVGYTIASGDTNAAVAAALVRNINNGTNGLVGPNGTTAGVYAVVNPANAAQVVIFAAQSGVGAASATPPAGNTGNTITMSTVVQSGSTTPLPGPGPNTTATPSGGAPVCTLGAGPTTTCAGVTPFSGGQCTNGGAVGCTAGLATAPAGFTGWSIELVGNGSAAGPGSPAATYDARIACTPTVAGAGITASLNRFLCSPLPAYGAASNLAPTSGNPGAGTYNVPVNAVFPGAAGAFTPVNPTMYVVLNFSSSSNPAVSSIAGIDYIYANQ